MFDVRLQDWSSFYDSSSQPPRSPAYTVRWGRQKTAVFRKEERPELGWSCCSFVRYRLCLHLGQVGSITLIMAVFVFKPRCFWQAADLVQHCICPQLDRLSTSKMGQLFLALCQHNLLMNMSNMNLCMQEAKSRLQLVRTTSTS